MKKKLLAGIGSAVGVAALAGALVWGATGQPAPTPTPEPTAAVSIYELNGYAEAPAKPAATEVEAEQVVEAPVVSGPTLCPEGTVAGAVDASGNESNCQPTSDGQPCVEYNDQNVCTRWYEP